jgi:glycosidase
VEKWITEFEIDGLRLDAADVLTSSFMEELHNFCCSKKQDFWLMGEVVHGDYNNWAKSGRLDSVTNYELYKGMWSSFNDKNFFEVAYSLNRQFGDGGIYKYAPLYNFLDNHDVNRIASVVKDSKFLIPLYAMLFTVPGVPSIYYGSEWGIRGMRNNSGDYELRPAVYPFAENLADWAVPQIDGGSLENAIRDFSRIKKENAPLQYGNYKQLVVKNMQFAFMRCADGEEIIVAFNCDNVSAQMRIEGISCAAWKDLISGEEFSSEDMKHLEIKEYGFRILRKM